MEKLNFNYEEGAIMVIIFAESVNSNYWGRHNN